MSERFAKKTAMSGEPIILPFRDVMPRIADDVFVAPSAVVAGDVDIAAGASVWFNATVRGDVAPVRIGERTNIQDGAILHVDPDAPCLLGRDIVVGHGAIVHGAVVGDGVMIGMGAIVLSHARIGAGAIVAAGAVVPEGADIAPGALVMGVPARQVREVTDAERARTAFGADHYAELAATYRRRLAELDEQLAEEATDGD